jgi:hypothetical protein
MFTVHLSTVSTVQVLNWDCTFHRSYYIFIISEYQTERCAVGIGIKTCTVSVTNQWEGVTPCLATTPTFPDILGKDISFVWNVLSSDMNWKCKLKWTLYLTNSDCYLIKFSLGYSLPKKLYITVNCIFVVEIYKVCFLYSEKFRIQQSLLQH